VNLRKSRAERTDDPNIEPLVKKWRDEHLAGRSISQQQKDDYYRQVRALIPEGVRFPRSQFSEDFIKAWLLGLGLSGSTKRRYLAALNLFYKYARKRAPLTENPFDEAEDWAPQNNPSRLVFWDHETRVKVIEAVDNIEFRCALGLMLGAGLELGAIVRMVGDDIKNVETDRTVVARGTKNDHRRDRTVFVDAWAEPFVSFIEVFGKRFTRVFPNIDDDGGNLRDAFYEAQVAAGVIEAPERSAETGKKLWKAVGAHTLHDSRHTYVVCRSLGLDGEPEQNAKFCAHQLGHANELMVLRIYGKVNLDELRRRRAVRKAA
jgi:integrase